MKRYTTDTSDAGGHKAANPECEKRQMTESEELQTTDSTEADTEPTPQRADPPLGGSDTESDSVETATMGSTTERNKIGNQTTHQNLLDRGRYRWRAYTVKGPAAGGLTGLTIHHAEWDPDGVTEHDRANLLRLCRSCHSCRYTRAQPPASPIRLAGVDLMELLCHASEMLRMLDEYGLLRTGAINEAVPVDTTVTAGRERLWRVARLDTQVEGSSEPRSMKDVTTQSGRPVLLEPTPVVVSATETETARVVTPTETPRTTGSQMTHTNSASKTGSIQSQSPREQIEVHSR